MKIRLLKNHNGERAGSEHDINEDAANYLVRVNVAEFVTDEVDVIASPVIVPLVTAPKQQRKSRKNK